MTEREIQEKMAAHNTLLKWILAGVAAGLVGIGAFAQLAFNSFMARSDRDADYLRTELKVALEKVVDATERSTANQTVLVRAIDAQTAILEQIKEDQRRGVWRSDQPKM